MGGYLFLIVIMWQLFSLNLKQNLDREVQALLELQTQGYTYLLLSDFVKVEQFWVKGLCECAHVGGSSPVAEPLCVSLKTDDIPFITVVFL